MNNPAHPPPSTPTSGGPVTIKVLDPLQVQVTHPEKRQRPSARLLRRWLWFFFAVPSVFFFWLWSFYLFPRHAPPASCQSALAGLEAELSYPAYLANGDEGEIQITFTYAPTPILTPSSSDTPTIPPIPVAPIAPTETITATQLLTTTVLVEFDGPVHLNPETPNRIRLEGLAPGEKHTAAVRFSLNQEVRWLEWKTIASLVAPISVALRVEESGQYCAAANDNQKHSWAIGLAPVYSQRRVLLYLAGTAGVALIGFLWGRTRKWLGYD